MRRTKHWPTGDLWLAITSHVRSFLPCQTALWRHHQTPEEVQCPAGAIVVVATSGEDFQVETATLVAITAARLERRAGETTDSRLVIGGEESSYRKGRLGGHEAEDVGTRLQRGDLLQRHNRDFERMRYTHIF